MPAATLSDAQLVELLPLIDESDSVELKMTVPNADHRPAIRALRMDPLDAQIRQVFFFDTPDLKLNKAGVVARARRVQNKGDDSIVKLRPVVPHELDSQWRDSPSFGVEVDAMPGGFVCSGTMKATFETPLVRRTVEAGRPLRKLFTKEQRRFFAEHAPSGVELDHLSILGPIFVLKLKYKPTGFARKLVAELWLYPDDSRILELSTKCLPDETFRVAAELRAFLAECDIDTSGEQQTKTAKALRFFSRRLRAEAAAQASSDQASSSPSTS